MCCFSRGEGSVPEHVHVANTRIFACRHGRLQVVVYAMEALIGSELAMVLPLPVTRTTDQADIEFVNLEGCPEFFRALADVFDPPDEESAVRANDEQSARLRVIDVGAFEASWVPTVPDFSRLDPRFRLPDDVWAHLPDYRDYGFAVFALKPGRQSVHPMAFKFATRDPFRLFFPTLHIHAGRVSATAGFDHVLFYQKDTPFLREHLRSQPLYLEKGGTEDERVAAMKEAGRAYGAWAWTRRQLIDAFEHKVSGDSAAGCLGRVSHINGAVQEDTEMLRQLDGIIRPDWHFFKHELRGELPNSDTWIPDAP